jgi:2-methylisocitrate lyase-like PEP mutase family enzyme
LSNQLHGGVTPILSPSELQEMGFAAAIYPTVGLFAASHALASVYQALAQGKPVSDPLYAFGDFVDMIGFSTVWDFEQKYADLLAEDQI